MQILFSHSLSWYLYLLSLSLSLSLISGMEKHDVGDYWCDPVRFFSKDWGIFLSLLSISLRLWLKLSLQKL